MEWDPKNKEAKIHLNILETEYNGQLGIYLSKGEELVNYLQTHHSTITFRQHLQTQSTIAEGRHKAYVDISGINTQYGITRLLAIFSHFRERGNTNINVENLNTLVETLSKTGNYFDQDYAKEIRLSLSADYSKARVRNSDDTPLVIEEVNQCRDYLNRLTVFNKGLGFDISIEQKFDYSK